MHTRMKDRLRRLEARRITALQQIPPGSIPVTMFVIAARLGGYPQPQDLDPSRSVDGVCDGFARGLGYRDYADMDRQAEQDPDACVRHLESAFTKVLRTERVDRDRADNDEIFAGLVRILDGVTADCAMGGAFLGWTDVEERLDDWIRSCGLLPKEIRAVA
ncbi:hypothetical protein OPKNFCMD_6589 [Methylobacterium crusticola]|uniref:Uncharacterized protein n=1 Tax=Methylobacterium crusticola TaxID=1697972 RepID=A0ABQ4RAL6_9HYPH|nr:hypothetical protein [Methylobacterium crusticola]GJD53811.1 hypothetical protein OPKNFCMD_6589 [Methylobacterium crusticola]